MSLNSEQNKVTPSSSSSTCQSHDYQLMKPIVLASWRLAQHSAPSGTKTKGTEIITESRVLQEVFPLPDANVKLVYTSSKARGYLSTIELRLTPNKIPSKLNKIHLHISIEGSVFEKVFEADPDLKFTYAWNRLNVYQQRVYGTTTAVIKVGYAYSDCSHVIWDIQSTKILGENLDVSDIGGWDFDIHHRYNYQEGILYKGDGTTIFLKERPHVMTRIMGDGRPRRVDCLDKSCLSQSLLSPNAIVSGPDGSMFIADFDLILRLHPDGEVTPLFQMKSAKGSALKVYLAVHPKEDWLYISDPESQQIIRVRYEKNSDRKSYEVVVGQKGVRCLPGDENKCGDGGKAKNAKLVFPKGLAIAPDSTLYFADGTTIRKVDPNGIITTLIGSGISNHWKPQSCKGTLTLEETSLQWPTDVAISPLDNTIHFIDDNLVMKVTHDSKVQLVAGRPLHCGHNDHSYLNFASQTTLVSPQSISFSPNGILFIAESDSRRINRISKVDTDSRISIYAGRDSKCNCQEEDCSCLDLDNRLAMDSIFGGISSISVGPDNVLYICDLLNRKVRGVETSIPQLNSKQEYQVFSPEDQEVYIFNRFGLHIETRDILSKAIKFKFSYSTSTSSGLLISVTDSVGNAVKVNRDYRDRVKSIENPLRKLFLVHLERRDPYLLKAIEYENELLNRFAYHRNSGLLQSKVNNNGDYSVFDYDKNGRLDQFVSPTGEYISLQSDLELRGTVVNVTRNNQEQLKSVLVRPRLIQSSIDAEEQVQLLQMQTDKSFVLNSKFGPKLSLKTAPYDLLQSGLSESHPVPSQLRTDMGRDSTVNLFEWQHFSKGSHGKTLKVNGESILNVEVNQVANSEIFTFEKAIQVRVNFSETPEFTRINVLPNGLFSPVSVDRNRLGQISSWKWGDQWMLFTYDNFGRMKEVKNAEKKILTYDYESSQTNPSKVTIATGGAFEFTRDENGGLKMMTTPRGHVYGFSSKNTFGIKVFQYQTPWSRSSNELHFDSRGNLVAKVLPEQTAKTIYTYQSGDLLKNIVGGESVVNYRYYPQSALVKNVERSDEEVGYRMRKDFKYHMGLLKECKINFVSRGQNFHDVSINYQFDGSARLALISTAFGRKQSDTTAFKFDMATGQLMSVQDFTIRRESLRKIVLEDLSNRMTFTKEKDTYGRLNRKVIKKNGRDVFTLELTYNEQNLISRLKSKVIQLEKTESLSYNANGQLEAVKNGASQWIFTHDINGNVMSMTTGSSPMITLGYDAGDRIVMLSDLEFVGYDERGFVIRRGEQRYKYNALGQVIQVLKRGSGYPVNYFYDEEGQLVGKIDGKGNTVQYVYANFNDKTKVTHVHYPKSDATFHYYYDDQGHLIAMDTPQQERLFIATDQFGTPMAVFNSDGILVKEINRSPFGKVVNDTNPGLDIHVGYNGCLEDVDNQLIFMEKRVYDPVLGQYMVPDTLDFVNNALSSPFQIFAYRFRNNNPYQVSSTYMTTVSEWLDLFGLDFTNAMGLKHTLKPDTSSNRHYQLSIGLENLLHQSISYLRHPNLLSSQSKSTLTQSPISIPDLAGQGQISSQPSPFGLGLLLTDLGGKTSVFSADGSEIDVVHNVLSSVLNSSHVLDICHSGLDLFYFSKSNENAFSSDYQELLRLSGTHNITGIDHGRQICAQKQRGNKETICVIYGMNPHAASQHLYSSSRKSAIDKAWAREIKDVKRGLGSNRWTQSERSQLVKTGQVNGFTPIEVRSAHKYPQLMGQGSNIIFVSDSEASKRRHNRN